MEPPSKEKAMTWIGKVIQHYREEQALTRKEITEGICSEKYLYMIERGERTPSSELMHLFNTRLGVNLFKYYEYLDCKDPVLVSEAIEKFNTCLRTSNFMELREFSQQMAEEADFQKPPYIYEIEVNKLTNKMFLDGKYEEVIEDINKLISKIDKKYHKEVFMANLLIIQSTALQYCHRIKEASDIIDEVIQIVCEKERIPRYHQVMATSRLNRMTLAYLEKDYKLMIKHGKWLLDFSTRTNSYQQISYTYFYLSMGYWGLGQISEMTFWLESSLYHLLVQDNPFLVKFMLTFGDFSNMIKHSKIQDNIRKKLKLSYPELSEFL